MVDLPPEEAVDVADFFKSRELDMIYLIAPTTKDERIEAIAHAGSGYVTAVQFWL